MEATKKLSTLSFSMCFVPFSKLRQHGKLVPHEEARLAGELVVIDTFDQLHSFLELFPALKLGGVYFMEDLNMGQHGHSAMLEMIREELVELVQAEPS